MDSHPILTESDYGVLRREKCAELTDDQFAVFRHAIERFRLDPFGNQIYFQLRVEKRTGKRNLTIQTGIDGYRLIADRTERYAGNDDPVFDNEQKPTKATVAVYKIVGNQRCAFSATARWDQYFPGDIQGMMWRKMPHLMLGKCAEALALRKAFPAELAGLYTTEEMQQVDQAEPAAGNGNGRQQAGKPSVASVSLSAATKAIDEAESPEVLLAVAERIRDSKKLDPAAIAPLLDEAAEKLNAMAAAEVGTVAPHAAADRATWWEGAWPLSNQQRTLIVNGFRAIAEGDVAAAPAATS